MYDEADYIMLSALQHYLYCPRQCALIHLEQVWAENRFTAEGRVLHERADSEEKARQGRVRTVRTLPIASARLGLSGQADVVEFHADGSVYPVEYKRGRPKANRCDEVQLCAQALCLEEMLRLRIESGALFYGEKRRRKAVAFDAAAQGADRNDDCSGSCPAGGKRRRRRSTEEVRSMFAARRLSAAKLHGRPLGPQISGGHAEGDRCERC